MTARTRTAARSADPSGKGAGAAAQQVFYPPQQKPLMIRLVQSISYPLARVLYKIRISVSEAQIGRVRAVDNARIVYVCNHPTMEDGITMFVLSARLGQLFHYIVAYEAFRGVMAWLIPRLGCYSIRRGMGDRASISQTLSLLKEPQCRLVIFPEGGCSYQNDTIMPFRSGAIQLPMSVLAQLAKKARSPRQIPDFYVVPLSLKYRYQQPMHRVIESTLSRIESELGLTVRDEADDYQRLRQVAHQVILQIETEAALPHDANADWNERIERLKQFFIEQCEASLNIEPMVNLPIRERVYRVQAFIEDAEAAMVEAGGVPKSTLSGSSATAVASELDSEAASDLTGNLASDVMSRLSDEAFRAKLYWDTVRLLNFDAIYDGYVAESPTSERFLDTLIRLEREVFHLENAQPKAPRKAYIHIAEPINLKDYLPDYQRDRSGTIDRLAGLLRQTMQQNLDRLAQQP